MNRSAFTACCGASIISGFSGLPDAAASYKRAPATDKTDRWGGGSIYLRDASGQPVIDKTFEDTFKAKLSEVPYGDHMFTAILTKQQFNMGDKAWPKILKREGFEFVRAFNNSVHTKSLCYLFVFVRSRTTDAVKNPTTPPPGWDELPSGETVKEAKAA